MGSIELIPLSPGALHHPCKLAVELTIMRVMGGLQQRLSTRHSPYPVNKKEHQQDRYIMQVYRQYQIQTLEA